MSTTTAAPTEMLAEPADTHAGAEELRRSSAQRRGTLAMLPLLVAYVPFALVIGATAADQGVAMAGWAGSWLIYGGSAHLAALRTLDDGGALMAILTGLLINARLLVYSAGLARSWPHQPRWFRLAAAGMIVDPTFALAERHAAQCDDAREQRRYFVAAGLTLGIGWSSAMAIGALVGSRVDGERMEIIVPLCLLALIGDALRAGPSRVVIAVAALGAVSTATLPPGSGILLAVGAGTAAGLLWDRRRP